MGLRMDPVGGGFFKEAMQAIVKAESQPIKTLEDRKKLEETRHELFKKFKETFSGFQSALNELNGMQNFRELKVDMGEGADLMEATVDKKTAQPGTYTMRIEELAKRSSIISRGFSSPEEKILGMGYVVVNLPSGDTYEVFVDESEGSLRGISKLINQVADAPIRATVVKDASEPDEPWKLIINAKDEGSDSGVEFPEFYFLDGNEKFWIDDDVEPMNALLEINDHEIEVPGNKVSDFLEGVNIRLKGADPDRKFTFTIAEDNEKIAGKMKSVVEQVNKVLDFINLQNKVDEKTDTRSSFAGDTSLQTIEYRLRNQLHEAFPSVNDADAENFRWIHLHQLGVQFDRAGKVTFDEGKFADALEKDFYGVANAVSGEMGFASQLSHLIRMYTNPIDGLLAMKDKSIQQKISNMDRTISDKEARLEKKVQSLTGQFSRLQSALSGMNQQSQYLSATLGGGGGNLVQQLLGG